MPAMPSLVTRKNCLASIAALLLSADCALASEPVSDSAEQRLNRLLDEIYQRRLDANPVLASSLGEPVAEGYWFDLSLRGWDEEFTKTQHDLNALHSNITLDALTARGKTNYRALEADLKLRMQRYRWRYHLNPINQIVGPHLTIAGTLLNYHPIKSLSDAEFYIARLQAVPTAMRQLVEHLQARRERGIHIPTAVVERLIDGAQSILDNGAIQSDFSKKIADLNLAEQQGAALLQRAEQAYQQGFIAGYQQLIKELAQQKKAAINHGAWAMPDGNEFYEFLIDQYTSPEFDAAGIFDLGLAEVARIQGEMDEIRQRVGFDGDLKAFFAHLKSDSAFYFPNTDAGRSDYLQLAKRLVNEAKAVMDQVLADEVSYPLQVRRIEAFREKSAPIGFYEAGSPDNGYLGTVFLGMYDMSSLATYDLPALLFHEGLPGHHLQSAVMQSKDIPAIRKYYVWWSNTAYTEGWALYAEHLANELGLYQDDYAQFGRLAGELWRACRLVVDSGLHSKQWSRTQAIEYLNRNTASSEENNARAVDRYLAVPGQATAFKVGMHKILDLRAKAQQQLGPAFDARGFHAVVLENGALPLYLLADNVDQWVAYTRRISKP